MCQIKVHEIQHGKELDCTPVVSRSLEHHADDGTFWLVSNPILRENPLRVVSGLPPLFPFHQPHERLEARRLFKVPTLML
ncbi:hypothetical protein TNCV_1105871 [Trichonephila clavipes]|nr:hypothetical protein TNCV_1105871 [Trichonephila clavipes]